MFENLKQTELLNCHIETLHRAMILTTPINGNSHQIFLNQQDALGTHAERAGGILYVHRCAKVIVHVVENQFCTEEVPIRVSSDNSSEEIRYMEPNSRVFYRNFTLINCNPMYPNAVELQNGSWITYGRRIQLIDKPNDMPNSRVNVNWSTSAPMEGFFNDKDLELSKRAQRLRHSRKTITGREVFLGQGGLYKHETLEYFNTDIKYNHQWHELLIFEYLGNEVKQIWHVAREITISLMTIFIGSKIKFCLVSVFLSMDMLRSGTNPVVALHPINPMRELCYFLHLKQRTKETKIDKKKDRLNGGMVKETLLL